MEPTNVSELNDSVFSNFTDFQDSLAHFALRQTTTWMLRHSASYSQKYNVIAPMTDVRKVKVSISRHGRSNGETCRSLEFLRSVKKRSSQSVSKKFLITNSKQFEQSKNAKFYRKNFGVSNRIFMKFINKILQR